MALIPPVPPIDVVGQAATDATYKQLSTPQVTPELAQKFSELRKNAVAASRDDNDALQQLSQAVKSQQDEFRALQNDMVETVRHSTSLGPAEHFEAFAKLTMDTSVAHMKVSLSSGMTKASNKSLQTLLKNE